MAKKQSKATTDWLKAAEAEKLAKKEKAKEYRRYGITARKYGGNDSCSWAVFHNGRPAVTGLNQRSVDLYKKQVLERIKAKFGDTIPKF